MCWAQLLSRGLVGSTLPCFSVTSSSALMWATARRQTSLNVFGDTLLQNCWRALTDFPAWRHVPSQLHPWCATLPPAPQTDSGSPSRLPLVLLHVEEVERDRGWNTVDYELFHEQCGELIQRSDVFIGETDEATNVVHVNVPMNNVQCMASVPPEIIIWVWKDMKWAFESSVPIKVIFGVMKLVGITTFMIAWENGMGRALTGMGGICSPTARSPMRCRSLRNSSLAYHSSSLLVHDASKSTWNWSCLSACLAQTSAKTFSWSALDVATVC